MPSIAPKLKIEPPKSYGSLGKDAEVGFQVVQDASGLIDTLMNLPQTAMDAAGYEMSKIASEIIQDSKDNYVPVDTGNLKDSADFDDYQPNRGQTLAQIGMWYAGDITAEQIAHGLNVNAKLYALEQHENLSYRHHGGGQAKFLEIPFDKKFGEIRDRLAAAIREALGTGLLGYLLTGKNDAGIAPTPRAGGYGDLDF